MLRKFLSGSLIGLIVLFVVIGIAFFAKYHTSNTMIISVEDVTTADYPEDPSTRSPNYDRYSNRQLKLVKVQDDLFDFIFQSDDPSVATVIFKNIDLSLFVPIAPKWVQEDTNLEKIALIDREWNRQQVSFPIPSAHVQIIGGDGFETEQLAVAELARNCLNAGLWEVQLFTQEEGVKSLYYQGWFNFPLGHYKEVFERYNNCSYFWHWYQLEHWFNPQGTKLDLNKLRTVIAEHEVPVIHNREEKIILAGEQLRKARTFNASGIRCWGDICEEQKKVAFATFAPPGRYRVNMPWGNEYERLAHLERAIVRRIKSPGSARQIDEVELQYRSSKNGALHKFIVSGIALDLLPQLPVKEYPKGLYMPMGIGVGPFYQSYELLKLNPPYKSPYFSLLLDEEDRWINHHDVGVDGPVIHRDVEHPGWIHIYLLTYERHSLFDHYILKLTER